MRKAKEVKIIKKEFIVLFFKENNFDFLLSFQKNEVSEIILFLEESLGNQKFLNFVVFEKNNILYVDIVMEYGNENEYELQKLEFNFCEYSFCLKNKEDFLTKESEETTNVVYCAYDLGIHINDFKNYYTNSLYSNSNSFLKSEISKKMKGFVLHYQKISFCFFDRFFILEIQNFENNTNKIENSLLLAKNIFNFVKKIDKVKNTNFDYIVLDKWYIDFLLKEKRILTFETLHRS